MKPLRITANSGANKVSLLFTPNSDLIGGDDLNTSDEDDEESIRSSQPSLEEPNYDTHNNSAGDQRDHKRAHNASTDNQANRR